MANEKDKNQKSSSSNLSDNLIHGLSFLADVYDKYSGSQATRKGIKTALTGEVPNEIPSGKDIATDQLGYSKEQKFKFNPTSIASGALEALGPLGSLPPIRALKTYVDAKAATEEPIMSASPAGAVGLGIELLADPVNLIPFGTIIKGAAKGIKKGISGISDLGSLPPIGVTDDGLMMPIKAADEPSNLAFSKGKGGSKTLTDLEKAEEILKNVNIEEEEILFNSATKERDKSIRKHGIQPQHGSWIESNMEGTGIEDIVELKRVTPELAYYSNDPSWIFIQVARKLNKGLDDLTIEDIKKHGQLSIINMPKSESSVVRSIRSRYGDVDKFEKLNGEEISIFNETPFGVEPGDIVTKEIYKPDITLTGNNLIRFLKRNFRDILNEKGMGRGGKEVEHISKPNNQLKLKQMIYGDQIPEETTRKLGGDYIDLEPLKDDPNKLIQKYFKKEGGIKYSSWSRIKREFEVDLRNFEHDIPVEYRKIVWEKGRETIGEWPMLLGIEFSQTPHAKELKKLIETKRGLDRIKELVEETRTAIRLENNIDFELDQLQSLEKLSIELKDKSKLPNKEKILNRLKNAESKESAEKILKRLRLSKKDQSKYLKEIAKMAWPTIKTIQALTIEEREKQK